MSPYRVAPFQKDFGVPESKKEVQKLSLLAETAENLLDVSQTPSHFACWVKTSADDILKYFFLVFPRKQDLTFCANCQILFSGKNNNINLSSAEIAHRVVKVKIKICM